MNSQEYEFYDAHPGIGGAIVPLPKEVKKVADEMSGKTTTLQEALGKIKSVTNGKVETDMSHNFIRLEIRDLATDLVHGFRVIRFR